MNETPYCSALLSAEFIQQDAVGKWNMIGVFDLLRYPEFPTDAAIAVFFAVTDGRGEMSLKIQLINADDLFDDQDGASPAGIVEGTILFPDPLYLIQSSTVLGVHFDHPGAYQLELWVNDVLLQSRKRTVLGPAEE